VKGVGKLYQVTGPNGYLKTLSYDLLGRPNQVDTTLLTETFTSKTTYDAHSRPEVLEYPGGFKIKRVYNVRGQLLEVQNDSTQSAYWTAVEVNAQGQVKEADLGNGLTTTREFNATTGLLNWVKTGTTATPDSVQHMALVFDTLANLEHRIDHKKTRSEDFNLRQHESPECGNGVSEHFAWDGYGSSDQEHHVRFDRQHHQQK